MCRFSVDRVPWFIFIAYLSYSPPRGELRCLPIEDLTVLSPRGELTVSSWRYWLPPYGDLDYLLVDILLVSSWRYWLPPHWLLVNNYCILVDNFIFWPASNVMIKLLAFFLPEDLLRHFFCLQCVFLLFYIMFPLDQSLLVVPTLQLDFVSEVTIRLRRFLQTRCDVLSSLS